MSPERWRQIEEIFQNALDLPASKRGAYIAENCADDTDLKLEVEKLLSQFEDASSFIETPALSDEKASVLSSLMEFDEDDPMIGVLLGNYRIEREIGRGGMGAVYEAIRADGEFRRKVAIKIVKRGMDTDFILRRFRNERQILATLEHPYITRLLDGGTTDDGRPYFVMDYIEGLPLYLYSDKKRLAIDERLKLFVKVCEAVEYAHQNLVIHRDLKPSNILVTNDKTPRLLDFGIAKLLNPEMASDTLQPTATAMRMMTIDYASPEQIQGEKVTFATDIYSLGVILFELLTGHRPYRFPNRTPHEIARVICEEPPMRPSEAITRSEETLPIIHVDQEALTIRHLADLRKNSPDKLQEILRGNLDNITLKALCKLPDERYQSVKKFREDIGKHIEGKPISTPFYFPINKVDTAPNIPKTRLIAVLPLKLLNFAATENTDENYLSIGLADAIISRLATVRDFTVRPTSSISVYEKSEVDPLQAGRELGVDFVLDGRIKKFGEKLRVSLQMLEVSKGSTIWAGKFDENFSDILSLEDHISEQVAEALVSQVTGESHFKLGKRGTDDPKAYEAYMRGRFFWNQFNPETFPKALESFERAVELDPKYALAYAGIADYYNWATIFGFYAPREGYQKTRAAAEKALEIDEQLSEAISILGFITAFSDFNWTEAERLFKQSLEMNPKYGLTHEWYSALLAGTGRNEEAYSEIMRALELDPLSLRTITLTAWTLYQLHRYSEALAKTDEIFEMSPGYYQGYFQRGNILSELGRAEEAIAAGRKGMEIAPGLGYMNYKLCFALTSLDRFDEAWEVLRNFEAMSPAPEINSYHFGMCYAALGERDLAFKWLDKAVEDRHPWCVWLSTEPKLDHLRGDERFNDLLRKTNRQHLIKEISADAPQTLAVLPFKINSLTAGTDTEEKFLGLGLTDALIARLSKAKQLVVRPTGSVVRFSENGDAFRAGKKLAVKYVLKGNIRRISERIRVSVQLLNVEQNSTEWAENFDQKMTDILELEDSISEQVVKSLLPQLTIAEQQKLSRRETDNPNAYEAYLKGRFHWNQFTAEALPKALSAFEKAVELDPNYALAYVGLADFYIWANIYGLIPSKQALAEAEKNVLKAIELDENLGEAYATLGLISHSRSRWAEAERLKLKAIELAPNYHLSHEWHAGQLVALGRNEEAIREAILAEQLDPLSRRTKTQVAWFFYQAHQFEEALKRGREIIELDKNYPTGYMQIATSLWGLKRYDEALPYFRKFNELIPDSGITVYPLCFGLVKAGKGEESRQILEKFKEQDGYIKPYFLAMMHVALGEFDEAFALFQKSLAEDDPWMLWFGTDPMLEEIRGDARYINILQQMDNPLAEKYKSVKPKVSSEQKSIAVLPFKRLGEIAESETDSDYAGIGLADAIISRLTSVKRLTVRPTNSVLNFDSSTNPFEAGKQLNVKFVVDGNIRFANENCRVTAQLLDIENSKTIWSQQFDEKTANIFELEDLISKKVANALIPKLDSKEQLGLEKKYTVVAEAYDAYLKGRYFWNKLTPESLFKSLKMFEKAIDLDPNFALAYVGLADFHVWLCAIGHSRTDENLKRAKAAAEKALQIDPTLIEANYALSVYEFIYEHNHLKSEDLLKKLIEVNPNYWVAYEALAFLYTSQLDFEKGIQSARTAERLNPLSTRSILSTARCLSVAGRFAESEDKAQETLDLEPSFLQGMLNLADAKFHLGKPKEAIPLLETCLNTSPNWTRALSILAFALVATDRRKEAEEILKRMEKDAETSYVSPYFIASVCLAVNQKDKAFEWLEKAYEERNVWMIWMESEAKFESIRNDKRFKDLVKRIKGLTQAAEIKPRQTGTSLAVLPLQFIGEAKKDDAYLAVGLADAMITRLSQVQRIIVRPTNSVLRFTDTQDSFAAGCDLGVDYVLCGTIRPAGKRIRISAQLLDIQSGATIWSEKFDEEFTDVLELEDKVAEKVAKLLIPQLTAEEEQNLAKRNVKNIEAYEAYLRGKYHFFSFTPDDFAKAVAYFEKAIALDPNYALAYSALSDVYFTLAGFASKSPAKSFPLIEKMAQKAVELDDRLGEAYSNLGMVKFYSFDLKNGEKLLKRGLELNPNQLNGYVWHSVFLSSQGKSEEAVAQARKAYELDPTSGFHQYHYIWVLYHNRCFDEAVDLIRKADKSAPNFAHGQAVAGWIFRHLKDKQEAIKHSEKAHHLSPETGWLTANLAATYAKFGQREKAVSLLHQIEAEKGQYVSPYCLSQVYLHLGDKNKTLELLEKSFADKDVWYPWISTDAELDSLRSEPRFINLIRQIRFIPEKTEFSNTQNGKTIAVLPFQFIGEIETGDAYLTVGLADAMITRLSRIKGLTVRPTTSILRFNNQEIELGKTAKELGVQFILNGHLKKSGNRLRITVQLLDALKNSTVWAETIDETLGDVLQLEDSICYKVLRSLTPHLTGEELSKFEKRGTSNPKAYEAYLKGRYHWHSYTVEGISKALVCYYEAIAEDENFALPYAGVADYYNFLSIFGVMSPEESFPAAKEAAEKAISLDENLAEAYTSLGITAYGYDWDFPKARKLLEKSLQLNPNSAETHLWYGYLFALRGNHKKAIEQFEIAESLNPQSPSVPVSFALTLRNARQYERGLQKLRRALEIQPNNPTALQGFSWFVNPLKNFDEAEEMCRKAVEVSNRQSLPLYAYGYTLASIGKTDEARKIIEELKERGKTQYVPPIYLALIYTALGEKDKVFEWLEKCFEVRDFWAIWLPIDPRFDDLRSDKRFKEFCQRIQPLPQTDETIHQSQIPTKIFTADELKGTKPEEKKEVVEKKSAFFYRHRFKFAFAGVLLVLVSIAYATGVLTIDFQDRRIGVETTNPANTKRSVAILPFKNETSNSENDFLCDGLSENLISRLQEVSEIQVLSRSTSFKYKTGELSPQKAGEEMQVEMILVGKLTEKSEKVEVSAELIDVKSGKAMWGFRYGRPTSELVDLQNQLAKEVSEKLKINPQKSGVSKSYTENSEAFELYLKGEYHRQKATPEDTRKSIEFYKKALELDANYALAHQGLALAYRLSPAYGTMPPTEAYPLAKESAMKALTIDPTLGSAYIPLASLKFVWDWDFKGAEREYKQAIQLVPNNPEGHYSYGNFLVAMGRFDEAVNELKIAQQFDPLSPNIASNIAWALYIAGRTNEAETQIKQVLAREPNFARAYMSLGEIYEEQGKYNEAITAYQKSRQIAGDPLTDMALGHVYAVAGRKTEALKIATDLEAKVMKKEISPFLPAVIYAGLNDKDKAFYWLERAYQERSNWLTLTKVGHRLKPLHGDPRFDDLLKRIGFDK